MDDVKQTIQHLREMMTAQIEGEPDRIKVSEVGAQTRETVVRLLKRDDLRIAPEILLNDLRNNFARYEAFEPALQMRAVEDALHIIEQLEILVVAEKFLNPNRITLPDPPPSMDKVVPEIRRLRTEGKRQKERLQRERETQRDRQVQRDRPVQRPPRRPARPAPIAERPEPVREELAFADNRLVGAKRRGRGRRPDGKPQPPKPEVPGGAKPENKPPDGGAPHRSGRRPRRRH